MDDLSSKILNARSMEENESLLEVALTDIELIGELNINEDAFDKIKNVLRSECHYSTWHMNIDRLRPAIFVVSLVFSARYSQDAIRSFWRPYAQDVWNIEYLDGFYSTYRTRFFRSRRHLTANFDLDLYGRKYGDIVYPVYRHAIIPGYLHDDFTRWYLSHLEIMRTLNREQLSQFIWHSDITYIAPTLQTFLVSSDTHSVALDIIQELCSAIDLLTEERDPDWIREHLPSLIHRELWDKVLAELSTKALARPTRQRHIRLEWVWSCDYEDWMLRLRNLITEGHQRPIVCIWSMANEYEALDDSGGRREYISPELQPDGHWYQREIIMDAREQLDLLDGSIFVFDENRRCIFRQRVPQLPHDNFKFYRITQQGVYAVPINPGQLISGECLVSYRGELKLLNTENQAISPLQKDYYVRDIMREAVNHERIERYKIDLPIKMVLNGTELPISGSRRHRLRASLSDNYRIAGTSASSPPVYSSNQIAITFTEMPVSIATLNLHISTPVDQLYEPLSRHLERNGESYHLDLQSLIPSDRIGTYTVDITRGFRSRLESPVEFSVLPRLRFSGLSEDVFDPLNLPSITVTNAANVTIGSPDESADVRNINDSEWQVTWNELRSKSRLMHIRQGDQIVPLEWTVERIFVWIDNGARGNRLHPEDLATAKMYFRGLRNSQLQIMVGDARHPIDLKARGEKNIVLSTDQLRDLLRSRRTSEVPLKLLLDDGEWQFGTFVRWPEITHFAARYQLDEGSEKLLINVTLSEALQANYDIQVVKSEDQQVYIEENFDTLPSAMKLDYKLPDGIYSIHIYANGEELQIPGTGVFNVVSPSVDIKANYENRRLHFDCTVDGWRPGNYEIVLLDSDETCLLSKPLNPLDDSVIVSVDSSMKDSDYDILVTWNEQVVGQTALFIPLPRALIDTVDYKDSIISVTYKLENTRPGEYALQVMDRDRETVTSYALNPQADWWDGSAKLARGSWLMAQIRWNEILIGQPFPFYVSKWLNLSMRGIVWPNE